MAGTVPRRGARGERGAREKRERARRPRPADPGEEPEDAGQRERPRAERQRKRRPKERSPSPAPELREERQRDRLRAELPRTPEWDWRNSLVSGLVGALIGAMLTAMFAGGGAPAAPTAASAGSGATDAIAQAGAGSGPVELSRPVDDPRDLPERVYAELEKGVDGDTIWVLIAGKKFKIRYLGIDTPESTRATRKGIEYLGKEASARNEELVRRGRLSLQFDGPRTDRFGRLLAYVWSDDTCINAVLLEEGLARVYRDAPNISQFQAFLKLEASAKAAGKGIWDERAQARYAREHGKDGAKR